jgi:hypothetical protein
MYLLVLVFLACKKEPLPETSIADPVFFVEGSIAGRPLSIQAGVDDYYLNTAYSKDAQQVYVLEGTFLKTNSNADIIRFAFRGNAINSLNVDSTLMVGSVPFRGEPKQDSAYRVHFFSTLFEDSPEVEYSWLFGDGSTAAVANPVYDYRIDGQKKYNVCVEVSTNAGSCTNTLCTDVSLPGVTCNAGIVYVDKDTANYSYTAVAQGEGPFRYEWTFEGATALTKQVEYCYKDTLGLVDGVENACLTVTDAQNCKTTTCENVAVFPEEVACMVNFDYNVEPVLIKDSLDLSTIEIVYVNDRGELFSSRNGQQQAGNSFNVIRVENYQNNAQGQPTLLLHIAGKCMLYSASDSLSLEITAGKIAVAYP